MTRILAIGCFLTSIPQALAAIYNIYDRAKRKSEEAYMPSPSRVVTVAVLCIIGLAIVLVVGTALWTYKPEPKIVEKPVIVEKIVPCPPPPPSKSGAASTHGAEQSGHFRKREFYYHWSACSTAAKERVTYEICHVAIMRTIGLCDGAGCEIRKRKDKRSL